jgi:hypothetical protein
VQPAILPKLLLAASLLAAAGSASAQQLAYRAAFSNDSGVPQPIVAYGWTLVEGGGPLASAVVEPVAGRRARDEFNAASPHGVGLSEGVAALSAAAVPRVALFVTGAPAVGVAADALHSLTWEWTGGNSRGHLARPVVKVNGSWFVADCAPFLTVNATGPFAASAIRAEFLFPAHSTLAWKPLPYPIPVDDSAALTTAPVALTGYVEEIGLWLRFGGSPGTIRIDNFEVILRR